jgi:lysophospholipase L1-like esterase
VPSSIAWMPLLPVLAVQGALVKQRAMRMPEPPGERAGAEGRGPPLRLLVLGDSAAAGVGAPHQRFALCGQLVADLARDFCVTFRLEASTGRTSMQALEALDALGDERFDVALTSLGVNDATARVSSRDFIDAQSAIAARLRQQHGVRLHLASGLPPVHRFPALPQPLRAFLGGHARRLDQALREHAAHDKAIVHLPLDFSAGFDASAMAPDGFHPGPPLYRVWAQVVATRIRTAPELGASRPAAPRARAGA